MEKYAGISMVTKLPKRLGVKAKKKLICLRESVPEYKNLLVAKVTAHAEKGKLFCWILHMMEIMLVIRL